MHITIKIIAKKARSIFKFGSRREKKRYRTELKIINQEINRSRRHNLNFSVLVVEVRHASPRGLSRLIPGKVISFHAVERFIRSYDILIGPYVKGTYYIILPLTSKEGANRVKERIFELSLKYNWKVVSIGLACFPEDGESSEALLVKAISEIS